MNTGLGLLYYGQNYLIYPSAFPPGSRTGSSPFTRVIATWANLSPVADVPKPTDFGLQYEDIALDTPDHIKVRAYLLVQRKNIPQATPMDVAGDMSDEEVRYQLHRRLLKP